MIVLSRFPVYACAYEYMWAWFHCILYELFANFAGIRDNARQLLSCISWSSFFSIATKMNIIWFELVKICHSNNNCSDLNCLFSDFVFFWHIHIIIQVQHSNLLSQLLLLLSYSDVDGAFIPLFFRERWDELLSHQDDPRGWYRSYPRPHSSESSELRGHKTWMVYYLLNLVINMTSRCSNHSTELDIFKEFPQRSEIPSKHYDVF